MMANKQIHTCTCNPNIKKILRENTPSNKTQALTNSVNTDIWVTDAVHQLFIRGSLILKLNFFKNKLVAKLRSL